jgi:hypothetical protein
MRIHKILFVKYSMLLQEVYFLSAVQYFLYYRLENQIGVPNGTMEDLCLK